MTLGETDIASTRAAGRRIDALDLARGVALIAMAIYHFTWDLENFGYVQPGLTGHGGWKIFARCIASSFLFLMGVSLVLAHTRGIHWRSFWRRWLGVVAGAVAITLVTFFVTPQGYVFFGILHEIALASLLGLAFLRLPYGATALAGLAVVALPQFVTTDLTDPKWLAWIGMAAKPPVSNDYVPLFPWFGAVLLGMAAAQYAASIDAWSRLRLWNPTLRRAAPLAWLGRHSLLFYLLHQPLLFGLVAGTAMVFPPDLSQRLEREVKAECMTSTSNEPLCTRYTSCLMNGLREQDLVSVTVQNDPSAEQLIQIRGLITSCSASAE